MNTRIKLSKISIFFGLWIVISAAFMLQVLQSFWTFVGPVFAGLYTKILLLIMGLAVTSFLILRKELSVIRLAGVSMAIAAAFLVAWQMNIIAEKIHIIEYALFGWLVTKDLLKVNSVFKAALLASLVCILLGGLDEAFQAVLPYRVFAWSDIQYNAFGGIVGVVLYLLEEV